MCGTIWAVGKAKANNKGATHITYDLHIHSCLSPCADDEMTPANIAGFAKLNGIELIAVADHNAADNLPAVQQACLAYGVQLLPAIEITSQEEIHLLAYFASVESALQMSDLLYVGLPREEYDQGIWGKQIIMNEHDEVLGEKSRLLSSASAYGIYELKKMCDECGAVAVPAHVDKESYSLLSVLGFVPPDLPFAAYEVYRPEHTLQKLLESGRLPAGQNLLTSSDAHSLCNISEHPRILAGDSPLRALLKT